jgi:prepilin-type N-terminal cleavage/methylation domain-containing protein
MEKIFMGKKRGFTIIELLIVIAIMAILSATGFMSYQNARRDAVLRAAQREVATAIRMTQGYALQGKTQIDQNTGEDFTPCGYGFEFTDEDSYRIFYTKADGSLCKDDNNYPGGEKEVDVFVLNEDVTITNDPINSTKFYFKIPFGVILSGTGGAFEGTSIVFSHPSSPGSTLAIDISPKGDIEEKDN